MTTKIFIHISILLAFSGIGFSQTSKIEVKKDPKLENTYEEISVLKSNGKIREGIYKRIIGGKLSIEGNYRNNERIGVWKIYNYNDKVEIEINYDVGTLNYLKKDTVSKQDILINDSIQTKSDRPLFLVGSSYLIPYYITRSIYYPPPAFYKGITGRVVINVKVSSEGKIIDYTVNNPVNKFLDKEAIRVVKLIPLEFLPECKNGKPVDSVTSIPINFAL